MGAYRKCKKLYCQFWLSSVRDDKVWATKDYCKNFVCCFAGYHFMTSLANGKQFLVIQSVFSQLLSESSC